MQTNWYVYEAGNSYARSNNYGLALKKLTATEKVRLSKHFSFYKFFDKFFSQFFKKQYFLDIFEDQFDFHTYALKKMTLKTYLSLLRYEDNLYEHKYFTRAAKSIVSIYLKIHENPSLLEPPKNSNPELGFK